MMEEIPVYLFTGFLDAGKTKFIQETLRMPVSTAGRAPSCFCVRRGEEEYDPTTFSGKKCL